MIYVAGPGHGGPGMVANTYLEGTYSEFYPNITQNEDGMQKPVQTVFLSWRNSEPRRAGDAGSIHEGGELGYAIAHAYGAVFDNPDLLVVLRGGRRRSGDRAAGHELAFQ